MGKLGSPFHVVGVGEDLMMAIEGDASRGVSHSFTMDHLWNLWNTYAGKLPDIQIVSLCINWHQRPFLGQKGVFFWFLSWQDHFAVSPNSDIVFQTVPHPARARNVSQRHLQRSKSFKYLSVDPEQVRYECPGTKWFQYKTISSNPRISWVHFVQPSVLTWTHPKIDSANLRLPVLWKLYDQHWSTIIL